MKEYAYVPVYFPDTMFSAEVYEDIFMNGELCIFKNRPTFIHELATDILPEPHCYASGVKACWFPVGRVVWNVAHPDDLANPWEEVHHEDYNKFNNCPYNLVKLRRGAHRKLHRIDNDEHRSKISVIPQEVREYILELKTTFDKHKTILELVRTRFPESCPSRRLFRKFLRKDKRRRAIAFAKAAA